MTTRLVRAVAWLLLVVAVCLTLGPPRFRPVTGVERHLEHFLAFALVGLMFAWAYPTRWLALAMGGIALTAALETLQLWVPGRHAYVGDFLVNALGICAGLMAATMWLRVARRSAS